MARSKSSAAWLKRHVSDPYVRRASSQGYRARSAYKLLEIVEREGLALPGQTVVDLGAAPGSWSQVLAERVGRRGRVIAVDLLEVAAIPGVTCVKPTAGTPAFCNEFISLCACIGPPGHCQPTSLCKQPGHLRQWRINPF